MKFDVKDVKSWANRYDVKIGDKGYFINDLESFKENRADNSEFKIDRIKGIRDKFANCFISKTWFGLQDCFPFFLPLDAVKEDKPKEKKYRPFKTINELEKSLNKVNRSAHQFMCVGNDIFIRNINKNQITHLIITRIDRDAETSEVLFVNGMSPIHLFNNYEIRVGAEWLPFGVEVENED